MKAKWIFFLLPVAILGALIALHRLKAGSSGPSAAEAAGAASVSQQPLIDKATEWAESRAAVSTGATAGKPAREVVDEAGDVARIRSVPSALAPPPGSAAENVTDPSREETAFVPNLRISGKAPSASLKIAVPAAEEEPSGQSAARIAAMHLKPTRFVPYGRLLKAELVITLQSTQEEMPLVGLITEPVFNNGKLVVPAGTEIHGVARPDHLRDRIVGGTTWRLVLPREGRRPNGCVVMFEGIALDREDRDGNGLTWGLADGSYGLSGRVIRSSQTTEELLIFAAAALHTVGSLSMTRQTTIEGENVRVTGRNAAIAGSQGLVDEMARQIAEELKKNGVYVEVPAGKTFYVYPRQTIDIDRAEIPDDANTHP